jgi:hypothetical protein
MLIHCMTSLVALLAIFSGLIFHLEFGILRARGAGAEVKPVALI